MQLFPRGEIGAPDDTLVIVSPSLMAELRRMAPKPRRSRVPVVLGLVFVALGLCVAADHSTREFLTDRFATSVASTTARVPSP